MKYGLQGHRFTTPLRIATFLWLLNVVAVDIFLFQNENICILDLCDSAFELL